MQSILVALLLPLIALSCVGCGSTRTSVETRHTTGQELIDLKEAYDQGIITQKEYERKRKDILRD